MPIKSGNNELGSQQSTEIQEEQSLPFNGLLHQKQDLSLLAERKLQDQPNWKRWLLRFLLLVLFLGVIKLSIGFKIRFIESEGGLKIMTQINFNHRVQKFLDIQQISPQQQNHNLDPLKDHLVPYKRDFFAKNRKDSKFSIPKILWVYLEQTQELSLLQKRILENIKWFTDKSGFQMRTINKNNYQSYLKQEKNLQLNHLFENIEIMAKDSHLKNSLIYHYQMIKKQLIMLELLQQHGGIMAQTNVIFTQTFEWLEDITKNVYINRANINAQPQYFAFYDPDYSSKKERGNVKVKYQAEKYMIKFPSVERWFLAAIPGGQYLQQVIQQYKSLVQFPKASERMIQQLNIQMWDIKALDPYYYFMAACQIVIQSKQNFLDKSNKEVKQLAINYYGLFTMNLFYFPLKLTFFFQSGSQIEKFYQFISKLPIEELQQMTGPLRYIAMIPNQKQIGKRLQMGITNLNKKYTIMEESFLDRYLFMDNIFLQIEENKEKPITNLSAPIWDSLTKKLWVYWDSGVENSSVTYKLCGQNLKKAANQSGIQLIMLSDKNLGEYLNKTTVQKIEDTVKNAKWKLFPQTKSDLVRLAIIYKFGGIYLDASYVALQNFDWVLKIAQYPSQKIYNRFGDLPKVLMIFHPYYGGPFQWSVNQKTNTKVNWHLAYESNFIAAQPKQELILEWFQELVSYIVNPYSVALNKFKECGIQQHKWTSASSQYLATMDAIKCVIGRRQKLLNLDPQGMVEVASDYYKLWSFNGYRGQQKFRGHTNYDNVYRLKYNQNNIFLWRQSQQYVQGLLGKPAGLIKMYRWSVKYSNQLVQNLVKNGNKSDVHPLSIYSKYVLDQENQRIQLHDSVYSLHPVNSTAQ